MATRSKEQTTDTGITITLGANGQYSVKGDKKLAPGRLPGVTSIIREANGSSLDPLMRWSQRLIHNSARKTLINTPYQGITPWETYASNIIDVAAREPDIAKTKGGSYGTDVHTAIENRDPLYPESRAAISFLEDNNLATIATEFYVYSAKHEYVGSIDFIGQVPGTNVLLIVDWKTGFVDEGCALQIGAYAMAFKEMYPDLKVDGAIVKLLVEKDKEATYEALPVNLPYAQAQFKIARQLHKTRREKGKDGKRKALWR